MQPLVPDKDTYNIKVYKIGRGTNMDLILMAGW